MKILLIEPGVLAPKNFAYKCSFPLGLMYLTSWVRRERSQHQFKLFDMMVLRVKPEAVDKELSSFEPDLVAIHAMTFQSTCMHKIVARVKAYNPKCVVAMGGPHASTFTESTLQDANIDILVLGEGEQTFLELVDCIEEGKDPSELPGTVVKRDGKLVCGPTREFIQDLDSIPFPAWDLIDIPSYFTDVTDNQNDISFRREVGTIFTSRACPYGCTFCHNMFGKKFRCRSAENVLDEMAILQNEHGIRELNIIDDCFNFDEERALKVMKGVVERGLDLKLAFPSGIRGDRLSEELVDAMVEAGVYEMSIGIESGSEKIQKDICKGLSLSEVNDGISRAAMHGIFTHGFFILGFPDETEKDMRDTIDFAVNSDLHAAGFRILSPFPGTTIYEKAIQDGMKIEFHPDDTSYAKFTSNLTAVDDATLIRLQKIAHWKFYGSFWRLYRIITTMPHPTDLIRAAMQHFRLRFL